LSQENLDLLSFWRKRDPLLLNPEGFQEFVERQQFLAELRSQLTIFEDGMPKRKGKYRGIWAVFASLDPEHPGRYCGLFYLPVTSMVQFELTKEKLEKHGDRFVCFEVMHEEILDYDPERPHVKGTFPKVEYYDYAWRRLPEKPRMLRLIEKHLRKVAKWYNEGGSKRGEPYPVPPAWEE